MEKLKPFLLRLPIYALIVALIGVGVWQLLKENGVLDFLTDVVPTASTAPEETEPEEVIPQKIIQMGESYKVYPTKASGHLECTVTGASVVTKQSECPPDSWFDLTLRNTLVTADGKYYSFDQWFAEGGAFDQGCRIALIDFSVTNIDAESMLYTGKPTFDSGWFNDPYVFYANEVANLADLSTLYGKDEARQYKIAYSFGFSKFGQIQDVIGTNGYEALAIRIAPGETVTYTLAYPIHGYQILSDLILCGSQVPSPNEGIFIDLKLGE